MSIHHKYKANDRMCDLICDNSSLLMVMSRFGMKLGFGNETVEEVCRKQDIDCKTFLAVVNFVSEGQYTYGELADYSLTSLSKYLQNAHQYFLDFNLPSIRQKLIDALCIDKENSSGVEKLILQFFDDYAKEVKIHMDYENNVVFKYVDRLLKGELDEKYNIDVFSRKHNDIETKLTELKNIIIKYYTEGSNNDLLNSALFDIFNCEQDLVVHCMVEDYLYVPAVSELERRLKNGQEN